MMTIKDIADEAGVSISTVSRVMNDKSVRHGSRAKVEAAIQKLDFVPNAFARGLMSRRSQTVGIMITSVSNTYYMEITEVIERRFRDEGSMLFLCSTNGSHRLEQEYIRNLVARQVEGIVIIDPSIENYTNGLFSRTARRLPLVLLHSWSEFSGMNAVSIDQELGMQRVMQHLWQNGHRKIAFLRGAVGHSYDIKENRWRSFLSDHGRPFRPEYLVTIAQGNTQEAITLARDACAVLLSRAASERPSAIFACNDLMALGAIAASNSLGIKIPQELSVIGHDNTALSLACNPPLSSVDLKLKSLGNAAVDLLQHAMSTTDPEPRRIILEPELVIRDSSGPCRDGADRPSVF
jgi:LacI family transcriptional regulator